MPWPAKAASPWTSKGKIFLPASFALAILFGASAADGDGIDRFQVAGIGNQMNLNFRSGASLVFAGSAHVIFHVAAAQNAARIYIFKPGKDFFGSAPGNVHDHIQGGRDGSCPLPDSPRRADRRFQEFHRPAGSGRSRLRVKNVCYRDSAAAAPARTGRPE